MSLDKVCGFMVLEKFVVFLEKALRYVWIVFQCSEKRFYGSWRKVCGFVGLCASEVLERDSEVMERGHS